MGQLRDAAAATTVLAKRAMYRMKGRDWRGGTTLSAEETTALLRDRDWVCLEEELYSTYQSHGEVFAKLFGADDGPRRDYIDGETAAVKIGLLSEDDVDYRKLNVFNEDGTPFMELAVRFDRASDAMFPTYDKGEYTAKAVIEDGDNPEEYLSAVLGEERTVDQVADETAVTPDQVDELLQLADARGRPVRCEAPMKLYFQGIGGMLTDTVSPDEAVQEYGFLRDQYTVLEPEPEGLDPDELWRNRGDDGDAAMPVVNAHPWQDRYEIRFAVTGDDQDGNYIPPTNVSFTLLPPETEHGAEPGATDYRDSVTVNQYLSEEGLGQ